MHYNLTGTELNSSTELDEEREKDRWFEKPVRLVLREEGDKENKALNYESKTTQDESMNGWTSHKAKQRSANHERKSRGGQPLREMSFKN